MDVVRTVQDRWRLALGCALALAVGALAIEPEWAEKTLRATLDGFLNVFASGWMC